MNAVGIDIVEIKRLAQLMRRWRNGFAKRVFTSRELAYAKSRRFPNQHLAARFAAKEAVFKALGAVETNFVGWNNIEIVNDAFGKPKIVWHGLAEKVRKKRRITQVAVSLSHTKNYAVASVVLMFTPPRKPK